MEINVLHAKRHHPFLVSLHWPVAILSMAALFFGAVILAHIPNGDPYKITGLSKHMIVGTLILILVLVRLLVRRVTTLPPKATTRNALLDKVTSISHGSLYVALIGQALMGLALAHQSGLVSRFARIDVLINNAGGVFEHRGLTTDGVEKTLAINHLAPFLLTKFLLDLVRAAPAGRIINVSSQSHTDSLDFANLQGELHYNFLTAYDRSKLCNILFTYELARRLAGTTITVNCLSPGPTVTRFGENLTSLPSLFTWVRKTKSVLVGVPRDWCPDLSLCSIVTRTRFSCDAAKRGRSGLRTKLMLRPDSGI